MITMGNTYKSLKRTLLFAGFSALLASSSLGQFWQWSTHFGGGGHDYGYIGAVDQAGNVYSYGPYAGAGPDAYSDMFIGNDTLHGPGGFVAKHDAAGNYLWSVNCVAPSGGVGVWGMVLDTANNVLIISGGHDHAASIGAVQLPDSGAFLAWIGTDGVCLNAQNIGSPHTAVWALLLHDNGDLYVAGSTTNFPSLQVGGQSIQPGSFIARFQADGTPVWAKNMITGISSQAARFIPVKLSSVGQNLVCYGSAAQALETGIFDMDTVHVDVPFGGGAALVSMNATTGIAQWIRYVGICHSSRQPVLYSQRMEIDSVGTIYCVLSTSSLAGDSARFAPDTAISVPAGGKQLSFLARYGAEGNLKGALNLGEDIFIGALGMEGNSSLLMLVGFNDSSAVDVCSASDGLWLMRTDTSGNCLGSVPVALNTPPSTSDASGLSIHPTPDGIYLSAATPYLPQFSTTSFAGESVTSHGWEDVLLAKCGLSLGVAAKSMAANEQLLIYANPNNGSFRIQVPDALVHERQLMLAIYDGSGRLVYQAPLKMTGAEPELDLHNLTPGLYEVTLGNAKRVYHGSMVVQ